VLNTTKILNLEKQKSQDILNTVCSILPTLKNITPPEAAQIIYPKISEMTGIYDLYKEKKAESIEKAKEILHELKKQESEFEDRLLFGLKLAVLGNVIDYGAQSSFCIESESQKIFDIDFVKDESALLKERLQNAEKIIYLADNAGENVFDLELIKIIKELYGKEVRYFVRGRAIINDLYINDIDEEMKAVVEVVDSGMQSPGFVPKNASKKIAQEYEQANLIISKGMGNFECLCDEFDDRIFFIFKVKCNVVAEYTELQKGSIVCARNVR